MSNLFRANVMTGKAFYWFVGGFFLQVFSMVCFCYWVSEVGPVVSILGTVLACTLFLMVSVFCTFVFAAGFQLLWIQSLLTVLGWVVIVIFFGRDTSMSHGSEILLWISAGLLASISSLLCLIESRDWR